MTDRKGPSKAYRAGSAQTPAQRRRKPPSKATLANKDADQTAAAISDGGDHARLMMVNAAVLGLGLITRNGKLMRTGVRMAIAQGLALGARTVFAQGMHDQGQESAEEASQRNPGTAGPARDDGVATGSAAATVAVARAASTVTPIPYIPARLAGLALTGRNKPARANAVSDFLLGSVIGWIAERLATRLVGSGKSSSDDEA